MCGELYGCFFLLSSSFFSSFAMIPTGPDLRTDLCKINKNSYSFTAPVDAHNTVFVIVSGFIRLTTGN